MNVGGESASRRWLGQSDECLTKYLVTSVTLNISNAYQRCVDLHQPERNTHLLTRSYFVNYLPLYSNYFTTVCAWYSTIYISSRSLYSRFKHVENIENKKNAISDVNGNFLDTSTPGPMR